MGRRDRPADSEIEAAIEYTCALKDQLQACVREWQERLARCRSERARQRAEQEIWAATALLSEVSREYWELLEA